MANKNNKTSNKVVYGSTSTKIRRFTESIIMDIESGDHIFWMNQIWEVTEINILDYSIIAISFEKREHYNIARTHFETGKAFKVPKGCKNPETARLLYGKG